MGHLAICNNLLQQTGQFLSEEVWGVPTASRSVQLLARAHWCNRTHGLKVSTTPDVVYVTWSANRMMKVTVPPTKNSAIMMNRNRSMIAAASIQSFISCSSLSFSRRWRLMVLTIDCSRSRISAITGSVPRSTRSAASPCGADDDEDGDSFGWRLAVLITEFGVSSSSVSSVSTL